MMSSEQGTPTPLLPRSATMDTCHVHRGANTDMLTT